MGAVFGIHPERITETTSQNNLEVWDSVTHINLILALEQEFDVRFSDRQIPQLLDFATIHQAVAQFKAAA